MISEKNETGNKKSGGQETGVSVRAHACTRAYTGTLVVQS